MLKNSPLKAKSSISNNLEESRRTVFFLIRILDKPNDLHKIRLSVLEGY